MSSMQTMRLKFYCPVLLVSCLLLEACGGPSAGDFKHGLEGAWTERPDEMATMSGLNVSDPANGALAGAASAAPKAIDEISRVNGFIGDMARDAARTVPDLAVRFGLKGTEGVNTRMQRALADHWRVLDLKIIAEHHTDEEAQAELQYTLSAQTASGRSNILDSATQIVRLQKIDGHWIVQSVSPPPR
jgi:hypothetical protein